jgi:hypothetical protein
MDLKETLRQGRARGREKAPFSPSLFSHVGGLVQRHGLGEAFLGLVHTMTAAQAEDLARRHHSEAKPLYEPPLLFLATGEEYRLIQQILMVMDNPYLAWAHSPEEILLSLPLWSRRPDWSPEALSSRHFAELFCLS